MTGEDPSRSELTERRREELRDEIRKRDRGRLVSAGQAAMEAVLAIAVAAGIGYWVDQRFGTGPRWLVFGTVVGFGSFVLRLWRMRKLFEEPPTPGGDA